jgi:hypothetical protein
MELQGMADQIAVAARTDPLHTGASAAGLVPAYVCPSRGSRPSPTLPKTDYAEGTDPTFWMRPETYEPILCGIRYKVGTGVGRHRVAGVSLASVSSNDGASNTFLLAHKFVTPNDFSTETDSVGWATPALDCNGSDPSNITYDHYRCPYGLAADTDPANVDPSVKAACAPWDTNGIHFMGSPHPEVMPIVLADGSVRSVGLSINPVVCGYLWFYNDNQPVSADAY